MYFSILEIEHRLACQNILACWFLYLCYHDSLGAETCFLLGESTASEIQTPGNHPDESLQHSEHEESLKSRI
jgi:hypothetical protein